MGATWRRVPWFISERFGLLARNYAESPTFANETEVCSFVK